MKSIALALFLLVGAVAAQAQAPPQDLEGLKNIETWGVRAPDYRTCCGYQPRCGPYCSHRCQIGGQWYICSSITGQPITPPLPNQ